MRLNRFVPYLLVVLIAGFGTTAVAQQDPEQEAATRGSFISSRPSASLGSAVGGGVGVSSSSSNNKSTGKTTSKSSSKSSTKSRTKSTGKSTNKGTTTTVGVKTYSGPPIGLGYTMYMRNDMGEAVRIDPDRVFYAGDRIRLSMEPNTDGYLYVFHTENDGPPTLIFPDWRLNGGDNAIEAHVPYEVPSPFEANETLRWFTFDNKAARERLYIVITREPIPGTPIGDDLVNFCRDNESNCPLRMKADSWARIKVHLNARVRVSKSKTYGQTQTRGEQESTTRGLGLNQSAPEPSVVRMNVSSTDGFLVTALDLEHR